MENQNKCSNFEKKRSREEGDGERLRLQSSVSLWLKKGKCCTTVEKLSKTQVSLCVNVLQGHRNKSFLFNISIKTKKKREQVKQSNKR